MMKKWWPSLPSAFLLLSLALGGCDDPAPPPEPTEPWLARPSKQSSDNEPARTLICDVASDARLQFRLPAKEAAARGSVGGLGGAFTVELGDWGRTRGTVLFDLATLTVAADRGGDDPERTLEAANWLGLGNEVPNDERRKRRFGRFEIDALHELSAARLDVRKAIATTDGKARVLTVRAVAVGRLVIRNLAVTRRVPIEIDFRFGPVAQADESPSAIVVRLRAVENVPLAEHDIAPRDAAGKAVLAGNTLLGRVIGKTALVSGEIALRPRVL